MGEMVAKHLIKNVKNLNPPLLGRLATPQEIPYLKSLGLKIMGNRAKLIRVEAVKDFLEHGTDIYRPTPKKLLYSKGLEPVAAPRKKLRMDRSSNLPVNNTELKEPPFSIIQLVCQALLNSMNKGLTTREIMNWILKTQPHRYLPYNLSSKVHHALSDCDFFDHSFRRSCEWCIVDEYEARVRRIAFIRKPPFSLVKLMAQALFASQNSVLTMREIVAWIKETYPYYQTLNWSRRVPNALSTSKFFVKLSDSHLWSTVDEYEASLRKIAYIPDTMSGDGRSSVDRCQQPARSTTAEGLLLPPETTFVDEASETTPDEVQILAGNLLDEESIVSFSNNYNNTQSFTEQECQPVQASETSSPSIAMEQEQTRPAMTVVAASAPQEIKPEILDVINLVEDQPTDPIHELDCKINPVIPITLPTLIDTIDLTDNEVDLPCPLCDALFTTKGALGEHVITHRKAQPNNDATRTASEALRNITSSLSGSNSESVQKMISSLLGNNCTEAPIFYFPGNVYFTTPNTPTTS